MTPDEIRATLKAKNLKVISHEVGSETWHRDDLGVSGIHRYDFYVVVWVDGDKTKYGHINASYTHRYGIRVLATYNGRTFWFQSNDIADSIPDTHLEHIKDVDAGIFTKLKDFDPVLIEVSW